MTKNEAKKMTDAALEAAHSQATAAYLAAGSYLKGGTSTPESQAACQIIDVVEREMIRRQCAARRKRREA